MPTVGVRQPNMRIRKEETVNEKIRTKPNKIYDFFVVKITKEAYENHYKQKIVQYIDKRGMVYNRVQQPVHLRNYSSDPIRQRYMMQSRGIATPSKNANTNGVSLDNKRLSSA
jgi:hypothetical protein